MSKKIVAFCLAAMMIFCLVFANAYAAESKQLSTSGMFKFYDGEKDLRIGAFEGVESLYAKINFTPSQTGNVDIVIASFGAGKILNGVKILSDIPVETGIVKEYTTEKISTEDAESIMVYVWSSKTIKPVVKTPGIIGKTGVYETKFVPAEKTLVINEKVSLGELFSANESIVNEIDDASVVVEVPEGVTYVADASDWTKGTVEAANAGGITLTIYDNFLCEKTTATFTVVAPETKFVTKEVTLVTDVATKLGDMFAEIEGLNNPVADADVAVTVDGAATYIADTTVWENGTITATEAGEIKVTITDNNLCIATEAAFMVEVPQPVDKFAVKFPDADKSLYRVGDTGNVAVGTIFSALEGAEINSASVSVTIEAVDGVSGVSGTHTNNTSDWTKGTVDFNGYGVVKVTVTDNNACNSQSVYLEVINATNATASTNATANNVVLLNDISSSGITISNRNTLYGNGFKIRCAGTGAVKSSPLQSGFITIEEGGILENAQLICDVYPKSYMYKSELPSSTEANDYVRSGIAISGNDSTVSNCYIYGARNNIYSSGGNIVVKDTVLECGSLSNIQLKSASDFVVTLDNVTTVQYRTTSPYDSSVNVLGFGVLVGDSESSSNPTIRLKGNFKQYNWVTGADTSVSNKYASMAISAALKETAYQHTINGETAVNVGIAYMNNISSGIIDERDNKTDIPYELNTITMLTEKGQVYSVKAGSAVTAESGYNPETDGVIPYESGKNPYYTPQFKVLSDLGGQYIEKTDESDEYCIYDSSAGALDIMFVSGDVKEIDLTSMVSIEKYSGQNLNTVITCVDENGENITVTNGKVNFSQAMGYTVTYTVEDNIFYDNGGNAIEDSKTYSFTLPVNVSTKDVSVPNAEFEFVSENQVIYRSGNSNIKQFIPFLAGLKIYDYNGQTRYLRFDGDSDYTKIAKASIENLNTSGEAQGYHIVTIELADGGKLVIDMDVRANSGSSTHTGSIKVRNNVLYVVNGGTTSGKGQTWRIYSYKFVGNNGVEINSGEVLFGTAGVDCSTATTPSSNFSNSIKATVIYDANGGYCVPAKEYSTSNRAALTLPVATKSGYLFVGWFTAESGGTFIGKGGASYTPSGDITLYAQWGKASTVTYNSNGGTCSVTTDTFTGDALVLPSATMDGMAHIGWYTAASGGTKIGAAGESYVPTGDITLYAQWATPPTVTYNANGGSCSVTSDTYTNTALTLPTPTRSGYRFTGWYTAASGGTKAGDAGAAYTPSADITLYAQWIQQYTVTYNANSGSVSPTSATCDAGASLTLPTPTRSSYDFTGWYTAASGGTKVGSAGASYTPTASITLYAQWNKQSCVTGDTLVNMADGSKKRIDEVTYEDTLLSWNFFEGKYDAVPASVIFYHGDKEYRILNLNFSDGTTVKVIDDHGFFSVAENNFVNIDEKNADSYIGQEFVKVSDGKNISVKLSGYEITNEYTGMYSIQTAVCINFIVEDMLSITRPPLEGWFDYFEIGDNMKYDEAKMKADIEKYGLYEYEEFSEFVTYEQFMAFNGPYLKVLVGRGVLSQEKILDLIELYVAPLQNK